MVGRSCRICCGYLANRCRKLCNYIYINWLGRYLLFDHVTIDMEVDNSEDIITIENFYLCNNHHTINKLKTMLNKDFDKIMMHHKERDIWITINRKENYIQISDVKKRIILGDISLAYIFLQ